MNQPAGLSMSQDGWLLVLTAYGVVSYDPQAAEAQLLFLDAGSDEIGADFGRAADAQQKEERNQRIEQELRAA